MTQRWTCSPPCWARSGRRRPQPLPAPDWLGAYTEPETGLSVRIDTTNGQVRLRYGHFPDRLDVQRRRHGKQRRRCGCDPAMAAFGWTGHTRTKAHACAPAMASPQDDIAGRYRCDELDAELTVADAGGVLYGGFSGFLGQGRMETLGPVGADVWVLPCPRALDHTPPGDWTLASAARRIGPRHRRRGRLLAGPSPGL